MFTNEPGSGSPKFANFKKGKIVHKVGNEKVEDTHIEGRIVFLTVEDADYEGESYRKLTLTLRGEDGTEILLGFPINSGYGQSFCCMCPNIDTAKPVKISGGIKTVAGKDYSSMFVQQDGKFVKWFYTKDSEKKLPAPEPINHKGKFVKNDWTARNEFMEKLIEGFEKKVVKSNEKNPLPATTKTLSKNKKEVAGTKSPDDDLPF